MVNIWWYSFRTAIYDTPLELFNTLRPRKNGHRFADDTFKRIFLNENVRISIEISLKFNIPALVQKMAWRPTRQQAIIGTNDD